MEQENTQAKKKNNHSKRNVILAILLGFCIIVFAVADGYLLVSLHQSDKTEAYVGKDEDKQQEAFDEDADEDESSEAVTDSLNGFTAGNANVSAQPTAAPTAEPQESATKDNGISNEDYILPDSDSKYYSKKDLKKLTREEVKLARNEIYARHGRKFVKDMTVKEYFEGKDWYSGTVDDVKDSELNKYEIANRDLIVKYEKKKKWN